MGALVKTSPLPRAVAEVCALRLLVHAAVTDSEDHMTAHLHKRFICWYRLRRRIAGRCDAAMPLQQVAGNATQRHTDVYTLGNIYDVSSSASTDWLNS